MKKVLLVFLSVLLVATFIFGVYFHVENTQLRAEEKVRVFSLNKWLRSFSEVEFPDLSLADVWSGATITIPYSPDRFYSNTEVMQTFTVWQLRCGTRYWAAANNAVNFSKGVAGASVSLSDCEFHHTNGNVFTPVLYDEDNHLIRYDKPENLVWVVSTYVEDLTIPNDNFGQKLSLTFELIFEWLADILELVSKIVPWDAYEIIDIPNQSLWGGT